MKKIILLTAMLAGVQFVIAQQKPNILFILADDLGYGDIGVFYQNFRLKQNDRSLPYMQTPNIDKLANGGAMLLQHYSAAPVCAPSRASIFLGKSQGHANVRDNQFDKALEDNYTLPGLLKKAGYRTGLFGKWGLQGTGADTTAWVAHPLKRGFDHFYGYMRHSDGHEHYPKEGLYRNKKQVWDDYAEVSSDLDKCYTADLWTASVKEWIKGQVQLAKANPFFAFLSFDTPHAVLELPTQAYPAGGGLTGGVQWLGKKGQMINTASGQPDSYTYPEYAAATYDDDHNASTPEIAWPATYKRYASSVRRIDEAVGDLLQLLKDLKIDNNTIVVFSSDNGPSIESYLPKGYAPYEANFFDSFGPFSGIKRDCWEGGLRMPAIAYWQGHIPAGTKIESPNAAYDWMPTFLEAAGTYSPVTNDGLSMLPSLTGRGKAKDNTFYTEYAVSGTTPGYNEFAPTLRNRKRNQMQMIRSGNYVGVRYNIQSQQDDFEIYDVVNDPRQTKNLAATLPKLQSALKEKVLQMRLPDTTAKRPYDSELIPAIDAKVKAGVAVNFFAGKFDWLPRITQLKAGQTQYSKSLNGIDVASYGSGAVAISGYIQIPKDGEYAFYTSGNCFLRLHQVGLIDAAFSGGKHIVKINLKAGLHPFSFSYLPAAKSPVLQWSTTDAGPVEIPGNMLFH